MRPLSRRPAQHAQALDAGLDACHPHHFGGGGGFILLLRQAKCDSDGEQGGHYGADIAVVPRSQELPLTYGGVRVGGLTYDARPLTMDDVALIRTIKNRDNVNPSGSETPGARRSPGHPSDGGRRAMEQELGLKKWWQIEGRTPSGAQDVLLGSRAAARLGKQAGSTVELGGQEFQVAGVLRPTGSQEDDILFLDLATAQRLWDRPAR